MNGATLRYGAIAMHGMIRWRMVRFAAYTFIHAGYYKDVTVSYPVLYLLHGSVTTIRTGCGSDAPTDSG
jgi:hypothetical protein